jgi:hypothetical protein
MKKYIALISIVLVSCFLLHGEEPKERVESVKSSETRVGGAVAPSEDSELELGWKVATVEVCKAIARNDHPGFTKYLNVGHTLMIANGNCGYLVEGYTPLQVATMLKNSWAAAELVQAGADVNRLSPQGYSPIQYAVMNSDMAITSLLYGNHADITIRAEGNISLLDLAWWRGGYMFSYFLVQFIQEIAAAQGITIVITDETDKESTELATIGKKGGVIKGDQENRHYFYVRLPSEEKYRYLIKKYKEWKANTSTDKGPNPATLDTLWITPLSMKDIFSEAEKMGILNELVEMLILNGLHVDSPSPAVYSSGAPITLSSSDKKRSVTILEYAQINNLPMLYYWLRSITYGAVELTTNK